MKRRRAKDPHLEDQLSTRGQGAASKLLGDDVPQGTQGRVEEEDEAGSAFQVVLHAAHLPAALSVNQRCRV